MKQISYPKPIDLCVFEESDNEPLTKYGLPSKVMFCKKCVISNQRPNSTVEHLNIQGAKKNTINFDDEGVCDACRFAEKKKSAINWKC